jgi:hypothetical protein
MSTGIPQQPYFLRALYEWCVDSGYAPHISVKVDARCKVPMAFVKEGQIVLNIGPKPAKAWPSSNRCSPTPSARQPTATLPKPWRRKTPRRSAPRAAQP